MEAVNTGIYRSNVKRRFFQKGTCFIIPYWYLRVLSSGGFLYVIAPAFSTPAFSAPPGRKESLCATVGIKHAPPRDHPAGGAWCTVGLFGMSRAVCAVVCGPTDTVTLFTVSRKKVGHFFTITSTNVDEFFKSFFLLLSSERICGKLSHTYFFETGGIKNIPVYVAFHFQYTFGAAELT